MLVGATKLRCGLVAAVLFSCLAVSVGAEAYSITNIGTSNGTPGGLPIYEVTGLKQGDTFVMGVNQTLGSDTLNATAAITVAQISGGFALLDITIDNTSSGANRITSFGLGITPNAVSGSITDLGGNTDTDALSTFDTSNFPGFSLVEFCAGSGKNCAGGGKGGLLPGQHDVFQFSLQDYTGVTAIDLSQFAFKFQGGVTSYDLPGGQPPPPGQVPQPMPLILLGIGLLGGAIAATGRRR